MMNNSQIKIIYKKPTEYDNLTINSINNNIIYDDNQSILDIENTAVDRPKSATLWVSGGTTKKFDEIKFLSLERNFSGNFLSNGETHDTNDVLIYN